MDIDKALQASLEAAKLADDIMMQHYGTDMDVGNKAGARGRAEAVVTEADLLCDEAIVSYLEGRFPDAAIVSEESWKTNAPDWSAADWVFFVDPIDGSLSYLEGSDSFGVSIGLVHRGKPVVGVVTNPALKLTAWGQEGKGGWLNDKKISFSGPPLKSPPQLLLSIGQNRSRSYRFTMEFLDVPDLMLRRSVVTKALFVLKREADYYFTLPYEVFHGGQPNAWDLAGSAAIVTAAGGRATDMFGNPLVFNGPDVRWGKGHIFAHPQAYDIVMPLLRDAIEERSRLEWKT